MTQVEYGLPRRQWNSTKSIVSSEGRNSPNSSRPSTPSKDKEHARLELDARRKALGKNDKDSDSVNSSSTNNSVTSLLDALERSDPSRLTKDQLRMQRQRRADRAKSRRSLTRGSHEQFQADEKRAQARNDHISRFGKVPCQEARPPALYPKWRQVSVLPEQRVLGVQRGPPKGDGGGTVNALLACPRDKLVVDTERAWASQLRSLAFATADSSHRYGKFAANPGTVLGAEANPDKITSSSSRNVYNTFNSYRTADLATAQKGAKRGGMQPDIPDEGPLDWFQG
eukprot:CAMPEP_0171690752 /NCGR_PEP_ID=MMETSP0991-20121206/5167_1 /TAXON_ID=483369 /ORGANISM="non described non described, Strain CCMP2098" /LENGTH=283 /DNA_ID=CAMNT_0012278923 /DNA_START=29 /DNA_END=880 /DNA_ORIENTATION=-